MWGAFSPFLVMSHNEIERSAKRKQFYHIIKLFKFQAIFISRYLKAKELDHRFFTTNDEQPPTHLAVYHKIKPEDLKKRLLEKGGENEKYKLIPPPKAE